MKTARHRRHFTFAVAALLGLGGPSFACMMNEGIPCEKSEAVRHFRAGLYSEVRGTLFQADDEERAEALVRSVFLVRQEFELDRSMRHFDYSSLPPGAKLAGVEFAYNTPNKGDREVRIQLELPASFINSRDFNQYNATRIGAEFLGALYEEGFNRTFLYVRDPATGEMVDIQDLLPQDIAPEIAPEVDHASLAMLETGEPRFMERSFALVPTINPGQPAGSLSNKTIYINQSHGWFDDYTSALNRWRVQRGANFGVLEDFDSAEFINLYVLPALRNAGAKVQTVRESDLQTNMVIVDNADAEYAETGTWSNSSLNGFKQKTGASWNGTSINPFNQGSGANRLSNGLTSGTPTATATWTADIPEDGYYNVYASWTAFSARANDAQYLVHHSGGVSEVRMNQKIDGYTWNLLGNWYFEADAPASERKVVLTNNSSDGSASNVSADAVRWGGGMGDMARHTNGISNRPRWEEEAVNYLQWIGFGYSGDLYTGSDDEAGGWADRPQYARWEHSGKDGGVEDALYFAWHTNAFNGSARGFSSFRHSSATAASQSLQFIMHDTIYDHIEGQWFPGWTVRSKNVTNFGENNQSSLGTGLPGVLLEGLFHDNATDAGGYAEPQFRADAARAIVHALVEYYETRDSISLSTPPETPTNFRVVLSGSGEATLSWNAPPNSSTNQYLGDAATGYRVYTSTNGFGFDDGFVVAGTSTVVSGLDPGEAQFFRVVATNSGGQSFPTETLAASDGIGNVLIVNGFDRNDKGLVPKLTITNAGTDLMRLDPRTFQAFNYAVEHAKALEGTGVGISSASNEAVIDGQVDLADYSAVFWILGEESTVDETFSSAEQTIVSDYLDETDARLFLSGAEIGWDLGRSTQPQADRDFYNQKLRAAYVSDSANTYNIAAPSTGPLAGLGAFNFNPANGARYQAEYPDRIGTSNGSTVALTYSGGSGGNAAVYYDGDYKLIHLAFPFETISSAAVRADLMDKVIDFFDVAADSVAPAAPTGLIANAGDGTVSLDWNNNSEPDLAGYNVYRSTTSGSGYSKINGSLLTSSNYTDNSATNFTTYYYVVTAVDNAATPNESANSSQVGATPEDITPPAAPTGLIATAGDGTVSLDWNNNSESDLAGYNVYRSTTSGSGYSKINGSLLTSSNYTDNSVTNLTTYYYVVSAVDNTPNANESALSAQVSALPLATTGPVEVFQGYTAGNQAMFRNPAWSGSTNGVASGSDSSAVSNAEANDLLDPNYGSPGNQSHRFAWTWSTAGSGSIRATTNNVSTRPNPRVNLNQGVSVYVLLTAGELDLGLWIRETGSAGAIGGNGGTSGAIESMTSLKRISASPNWQYVYFDLKNESWQAVTGNGVLNGDWGVIEALSITAVSGNPTTAFELFVDDIHNGPQHTPIDPAPAAPTGLDATAGQGSVSLSWNNNSDPDLAGYDVYRSTTSGSGYSKINGSLVTTNSYVDNSVSNWTTYYYVIKAIDTNSNASANSSEDSAMPYQSTLIFDNDSGSPVYTESGTWFLSSSNGYNGGTYRYANAGGNHQAYWNLNLPAAGTWKVEVMYRASGNRASSARYDVTTSSGVQTVYKNQQQNNLVWVELGTWSFNASSGTVELDAQGSSGGSVVISDAVRLTYIP